MCGKCFIACLELSSAAGRLSPTSKTRRQNTWYIFLFDVREKFADLMIHRHKQINIWVIKVLRRNWLFGFNLALATSCTLCYCFTFATQKLFSFITYKTFTLQVCCILSKCLDLTATKKFNAIFAKNLLLSHKFLDIANVVILGPLSVRTVIFMQNPKTTSIITWQNPMHQRARRLTLLVALVIKISRAITLCSSTERRNMGLFRKFLQVPPKIMPKSLN